MSKKNKVQKKDILSRKIEKIYHNYGIDTSDMTEEEFDRIKVEYLFGKSNIDKDLKESEKFKNIFKEDIV